MKKTILIALATLGFFWFYEDARANSQYTGTKYDPLTHSNQLCVSDGRSVHYLKSAKETYACTSGYKNCKKIPKGKKRAFHHPGGRHEVCLKFGKKKGGCLRPSPGSTILIFEHPQGKNHVQLRQVFYCG